MDYSVIAADRIPWGRLNEIDMGAGGLRTLAPGTLALGCADIHPGARVEINSRNVYRTGIVTGAGAPHLTPEDPFAFPCLIHTELPAAIFDSGGVVLVDGQPAGVVSRGFGPLDGRPIDVGFTPLREGLDQLGLVLCTEPDCGLVPPASH